MSLSLCLSCFLSSLSLNNSHGHTHAGLQRLWSEVQVKLIVHLPRGFLRIKSGLIAVSTIGPMLMVCDLRGCACTRKQTQHVRTLERKRNPVSSTSDVFSVTVELNHIGFLSLHLNTTSYTVGFTVFVNKSAANSHVVLSRQGRTHTHTFMRAQ